MRKQATFLLVFLLGVFLHCGEARSRPAADSASHKRCAFDIGSGETKITLAEVTFPSGATPRLKKLLSRKTLIPFAASLQDEILPDALLADAVGKLNELREACANLGAREYSGVATSGFRMARNAPAALARLSRETDIPLRVISGDEEATLAFLAVAAAMDSSGRDLVVWDIGGGSLQFSMRALTSATHSPRHVVSSGHQGAELFRKSLAKQIGRDPANPVNPLSQAEMAQAIQLARKSSRAVSPEIIQHLRRAATRVAGVGGIHTESLVNQAGVRTTPAGRTYDLEAVRAAAKRAVGMTDENFRRAYPDNQYPASQGTNVALVLGYMEGLQIREVFPMEVTLADGLLVHAPYWSPERLR